MKVTTFHNLDSRFMPYEAGQRLVRVFETEVPDSDTRRRCVLPDRTRQGAYPAGPFTSTSSLSSSAFRLCLVMMVWPLCSRMMACQ